MTTRITAVKETTPGQAVSRIPYLSLSSLARESCEGRSALAENLFIKTKFLSSLTFLVERYVCLRETFFSFLHNFHVPCFFVLAVQAQVCGLFCVLFMILQLQTYMYRVS